jgi:hypothetical protein
MTKLIGIAVEILTISIIIVLILGMVSMLTGFLVV